MKKRSKKSLSLFLILALTCCMVPQERVEAALAEEKSAYIQSAAMQAPVMLPSSTNRVMTQTKGSSSYPDIQGHKYETALNYAISHGLLSDTDGYVYPDQYITKGEVLQGLEVLVGATEKQQNLKIKNLKTSNKYYEAVSIALHAKFISLNSGNTVYIPNKIATNEYVSRILAKIMCVSTKKVAGYPSGNASAKEKLTRAEFADLLYRNVPNIVSDEKETVSKGNVMINKAGITISNQKIEGSLIIGEGVASEQSPVEIYTVSSYWEPSYDTTSEAVVHGHMGRTDAVNGCDNNIAQVCDYVRITDDQEYVLSYSWEEIMLYRTDEFITYFALKQNDMLSDVPIKVSLEGEERGTGEDTVAGSMYAAFMSSEQKSSVSGSSIRTVRIYTYGDLDTECIPDQDAFNLVNVKEGLQEESGMKVLHATVGRTESSETYYLESRSYVELTIGCQKDADLSNLVILYNPEFNGATLKTEEGEYVRAFAASMEGNTHIINGKYYAGIRLYDGIKQDAQMWISDDGTYFSIQTGSFIMDPNRLDYSNSGLEYYLDGKPINLTWYSRSFLGNQSLFQQKAGEPIAVTENSVFEIRRKDGGLFYDMSGCEIGESITLSLSVHQEAEEIGVAIYDTEEQELRVELYSSGAQMYSGYAINACHFKLSNGTTTYPIRGRVKADASGLYFEIRAFKHIGEINWDECVLEFVNTNDYYGALKNKSGKPISNFTQPIWVWE